MDLEDISRFYRSVSLYFFSLKFSIFFDFFNNFFNKFLYVLFFYRIFILFSFLFFLTSKILMHTGKYLNKRKITYFRLDYI